MKTMDELITERQMLVDEVIAEHQKPDDEGFAEALRKMTTNYIEALKLALNPTPHPVAFIAIFALGLMRNAILQDAPDAEESSKLLAELWDVSSTTVRTPRIKRKSEECNDGTCV